MLARKVVIEKRKEEAEQALLRAEREAEMQKQAAEQMQAAIEIKRQEEERYGLPL